MLTNRPTWELRGNNQNSLKTMRLCLRIQRLMISYRRCLSTKTRKWWISFCYWDWIPKSTQLLISQKQIHLKHFRKWTISTQRHQWILELMSSFPNQATTGRPVLKTRCPGKASHPRSSWWRNQAVIQMIPRIQRISTWMMISGNSYTNITQKMEMLRTSLW